MGRRLFWAAIGILVVTTSCHSAADVKPNASPSVQRLSLYDFHDHYLPKCEAFNDALSNLENEDSAPKIGHRLSAFEAAVKRFEDDSTRFLPPQSLDKAFHQYLRALDAFVRATRSEVSAGRHADLAKRLLVQARAAEHVANRGQALRFDDSCLLGGTIEADYRMFLARSSRACSNFNRALQRQLKGGTPTDPTQAQHYFSTLASALDRLASALAAASKDPLPEPDIPTLIRAIRDLSDTLHRAVDDIASHDPIGYSSDTKELETLLRKISKLARSIGAGTCVTLRGL